MCRRVSEEGSSEHVPGGRDIWFFVLFESLVFTSYFCVYLFNRTQHEQAFLLGQSHLLLWLGVLETIVLLSSSWAVARCVQHARAGRFERARREAFLTAGFGRGLPRPQDRRVGPADPHGAHVHQQPVLPVLLLPDGHPLRSPAWSASSCSGCSCISCRVEKRRSQVTVETCATYWHTVDFFWVLIFALLYVVR